MNEVFFLTIMDPQAYILPQIFVDLYGSNISVLKKNHKQKTKPKKKNTIGRRKNPELNATRYDFYPNI